VVALFLLEPVLFLYAFAPGLGWAIAGLFLVGLVYIGVLSGLQTVVQLRAPDRYRGRILGIYSVALGVAYPIGSLIQGPLADGIGLPLTTTLMATLLLAILTTLLVRRRDMFDALGSLPQPASPGSPRAGVKDAGSRR
jgi:predicted MFS family arabinose efflux permease